MAVERVVLLGTKGGPSLRSTKRMPTSSLIEIGGKTIVVDAGLGVSRSLVGAGVDLAEIDAVFLTHLHSDHLLELGPLIYTAWASGLSRPIGLFGPSGTEEHWRAFAKSMDFDIELRIVDEGRQDLRELVRIVEFAEGDVSVEGLQVAALRVPHPPVRETYALRFDCEGWRVTFGADTAYFPPLAEFAFKSDILIHEAMVEKGVEKLVARSRHASRLKEHLFASHTDARDVARIAKSSESRHLVLNHLVPADDSEIKESDWLDSVRAVWDGRVTLGYDGLEIERAE
ncbi:MAG: MBL fold metallo-hydrolase [Albidovulum sp.]|nr:MBL fold metallo-hydrolase [Albidovulum sp.]